MDDEGASEQELATQRLVEELAEDACLKLFEAYGVQLSPLEAGQGVGGQGAMTGIIGFTGRGITGMCLVTSGEPPLLASNPGGSLRDWVAELSNQLAGRLKHKLLTEGLEVYITTPIVLRATRIEPLPRRKLSPRSFACSSGGTVELWVEVEVGPDFSWDASSAEVPIGEGETLLF
ncbi:MAG: hypothetical protein JWN48_1073 [Myxococcaceae bacterium]|nr:hypothetical protein [Myxococcaceae bacterium]